MWLKNLFDRVTALFGLALLSPLMLAIGLLIKFKMPDGPVFYKQKRIGRHGKPFTIYKFRTMINRHNSSPVSVKGQARITPLGAVLRKYKLDVLPELWNVLIGDMSFVGPRPDVPGYADKLTGKDRLILSVKPGITGPASMKYANEEELLSGQSDPIAYNDKVIFPDKVRINLAYMKHRDFWLDLKIIITTVLGIKLKDKRFL